MARNKVIHEGKQQTDSEIGSFILEYVKELEMIDYTSRSLPFEQPDKWSPPPNHWVKANFDAGFNSDLFESSTTVVVRDESGQLLGAACNWHKHSRSPKMA